MDMMTPELKTRMSLYMETSMILKKDSMLYVVIKKNNCLFNSFLLEISLQNLEFKHLVDFKIKL